jgi:predicted nucleotidyltransferase
MFVLEVVKALKERKVPFAIVGGYAMAFQGLVRATMDVDFVISLKEGPLKETEKTLKSVGLTSRIPVRAEDIFKFRKEYIEQRNLVAWSFVDFENPSRQVDILIIYSTEDIEIVNVSVGGMKIPVASLQSLIEMKKKAGRPQDLIDVKNMQEVLIGKKK